MFALGLAILVFLAVIIVAIGIAGRKPHPGNVEHMGKWKSEIMQQGNKNPRRASDEKIAAHHGIPIISCKQPAPAHQHAGPAAPDKRFEGDI